MIRDCTTVLVTIMDNKYNLYMYTRMHVMQLPEPMFYFEFYLAIQLPFFLHLEKELKIQKYFFFHTNEIFKNRKCVLTFIILFILRDKLDG